MLVNAANINALKKQLSLIMDVSNSDIATSNGEKLNKVLDAWHDKIINTKLQTFQDIINHENKMALNFSFLLGEISGDDIPASRGAKEVVQVY